MLASDPRPPAPDPRPHQITEPATTLTDLAIALLAGWCAVALLRRAEAVGATAMGIWAGAFAATALAAVGGAAVHGFRALLGSAEGAVWRATLLLALLTNFFMMGGVAIASTAPSAARWLLWLAAVKLAVFTVRVRRRSTFSVVIADSALTLVIVAMLQLIAASRGGAPSARWIVAGVLVSFVAAAVQRSGLALHRHFNHNDLYHVVQMLAIWLFYRGGLLF